MLETKHQIYLQKLNQEFSANYIAEADFFLILETPINTTFDFKGTLQKLGEDRLNTSLINLAGFENFLNQEIIKLNLPASFSLAVAFTKDSLLYIKTYGQAEIYLKRKNRLVKLIAGENVASGFLEKGDLLILTTQNFTGHLKDEDSLKKICAVKNIVDINQRIEAHLRRKNLDLISLFVTFDQSGQKKTLPLGLSNINFQQIKDDLKIKLITTNRKKLLTLVIVAFLLLIFIWSVVFGHQRRTEAQQKQKIQTVSQQIEKKLAEAEDAGFLNNQKALSLIGEAKDNLDQLKNELGNKSDPEVNKISALIKAKENLILKKEEKSAEEFFDLKIDNQSAVGSQMVLAEDNLAILDSQNSAVYTLSLTKKSLTTSLISEAKMANLIANQANAVFLFVKNAGIYKSDLAGKTKKVIDYDPNWGEIGQMASYNSNLYLLDKSKNQIYKYLATDNGYASGSAYFKSGQEVDLANANSLAINGSLYINLNDGIVKFTSGLRDGFKTNYPQENIRVNKIIADKNLEQVAVWDKGQTALYLLNKDGNYERTINAAILGKADDVVVFENNSYALANNKIYKIAL